MNTIRACTAYCIRILEGEDIAIQKGEEIYTQRTNTTNDINPTYLVYFAARTPAIHTTDAVQSRCTTNEERCDTPPGMCTTGGNKDTAHTNPTSLIYMRQITYMHALLLAEKTVRTRILI